MIIHQHIVWYMCILPTYALYNNMAFCLHNYVGRIPNYRPFANGDHKVNLLKICCYEMKYYHTKVQHCRACRMIYTAWRGWEYIRLVMKACMIRSMDWSNHKNVQLHHTHHAT